MTNRASAPLDEVRGPLRASEVDTDDPLPPGVGKIVKKNLTKLAMEYYVL